MNPAAQNMNDPDPVVTVAQLDDSCRGMIDELNASIEAYVERLAIQTECSPTAELAVQALQQPDTSWGRHAVARMWLKLYAPDVRIFHRMTR